MQSWVAQLLVRLVFDLVEQEWILVKLTSFRRVRTTSHQREIRFQPQAMLIP